MAISVLPRAVQVHRDLDLRFLGVSFDLQPDAWPSTMAVVGPEIKPCDTGVRFSLRAAKKTHEPCGGIWRSALGLAACAACPCLSLLPDGPAAEY